MGEEGCMDRCRGLNESIQFGLKCERGEHGCEGKRDG